MSGIGIGVSYCLSRKISGYDLDSQLYFDKLTGIIPDAWKNAVNIFVLSLKAAQLYNKFDRLWIHATPNQQNATISLVYPSSTAAVEIDSPSWVQYRGYSGDGVSSYLDSNYNASTEGINFTLDSASIMTYSRTDLDATQSSLGSSMSGIASAILPRFGGGAFDAYINDNASIGGSNVADSLAFIVGKRVDSLTVKRYKRGVIVLPDISSASGSIPNVNFFLLALNSGGSPLYLSTRQTSISAIGSGDMDEVVLYSIIQTFATSVGFNV